MNKSVKKEIIMCLYDYSHAWPTFPCTHTDHPSVSVQHLSVTHIHLETRHLPHTDCAGPWCAGWRGWPQSSCTDWCDACWWWSHLLRRWFLTLQGRGNCLCQVYKYLTHGWIVTLGNIVKDGISGGSSLLACLPMSMASAHRRHWGPLYLPPCLGSW